MSSSDFHRFIDSLKTEKQKQLFEVYILAHRPSVSRLQASKEVRTAEAYNEFIKSLSPEVSDNFSSLSTEHAIVFIGGRNSFSFKITDSKNQSFVLKIENNLKQQELTDEQLKGNDVFLPVRSRFNYTDDKNQARAFVLTEFLENGDIEAFSRKLNSEERIDFTLEIGSQMAAFMLSLKEKNLAMTDGKNSNFLYDASKKIRVIDFKSLVPTTAGLVPILPPSSLGFIYPNDIKTPTSEDAFQAYTLGRNIYQLLTGCDTNYLINNKELAYTHEVFSTPSGKRLKELIVKLVVVNPSERLTLTDALSNLKSLQNNRTQELRKTAQDYLSQIKKTSPLFSSDIKMQHYVTEKQKTIDNGSFEDLKKLIPLLKEDKEQLNTKGPRFIKDKIKYFEKRSHKWLTRGGNSLKAELIANAFMNLDISERANAHNNLSVRAALDYRRVKTPDIIQPNQTQTFLDLKVLYKKKPAISKPCSEKMDINLDDNESPRIE